MREWQALVEEMKRYARCRSPTLEGRPTAPTADVRDCSEQIATTEFVEEKLEEWFESLPCATYTVMGGEKE